MNDYAITTMGQGIVRISKVKYMPQSYLERYGILRLPAIRDAGGATAAENAVVLPDGKRLSFTVRPETDDKFWQEEADYLLDMFQEYVPSRRNVEGRPQELSGMEQESLDGRDSAKKFGISFEISEEESFYGLGEGGAGGIQRRGGSYQNWPVYQYNEIVIPLVYSNQNWGLLILAENRHFVDIDDCARGRLTVLGNLDELDVLLLYGESMKDILRLYTDVSGRSMLLPKWMYGLTYVAPIFQDQFGILNDMMKFREKHIPCDNVSLEPGWMSRPFDYSFEKNWNLERFHIDAWMGKREHPGQFLSVMRRFGFHVGLWNCLYYDLCDQEERLITGQGKLPDWYEHMKKFVNAGVDGFKIDPSDMLIRMDPDKRYTNGESEPAMHNISQVLVLKQMYLGFTEQTGRRPYLHYCGGYTGQQRWGGATTGDNGGREGSMAWLLNLAMSGFSNTTVDMDIYSPQAIHFGMLAPWAQHNAWEGCRQPWYAGEENEKIYTYYARLRYSLLPYLYSAAIECHETGIPMIRPMPLEFQEDPDCRELSHQYMLGESILLTAFTDRVYLPKGRWIDFWTEAVYDSAGEFRDYKPPKGRGGGFFLRAGAIIPRWCERDYVAQHGEEEIELYVYPPAAEPEKADRTGRASAAESSYIFREDDGESVDYEHSMSCHTRITCTCTADKIRIHIGERQGEYRNKPKKRRWLLRVFDSGREVEITCQEREAELLYERNSQ